ncbi:MAG: metal-dependent phosphohydrolase [Treponema sp.]|nr:metal-dependent phosphohydrolase [Treponema sp.]
MQGKNIIIPLSKVLSLPDGGGVNKPYIEIILNEEIPVLCVNRSAKKKRLMPFKVLNDNKENFWQSAGDWEYYFTGENLDIIKEKSAVKIGAWDNVTASQASPALPTLQTSPASPALPTSPGNKQIHEVEYNSFGDEYTSFAEMTTEEMIEQLKKEKSRLDELLVSKSEDKEAIAEALVDSTKNAAMINHAIIEGALRLADDAAKKATQEIVDNTTEMVKSSVQLISEDVFNNELVNTLVEKSNGTIVQHMTRVFLNGLAFFAYFNNLVHTSRAIQKLRITFASKFRKYYLKLLPHLDTDDVILERVFLGGMRDIPPEVYNKWAVGFLIHDIGKASAVEYHEGEGSYDRNIVVDHVKQGYKSVINKTNYPMEAALITGYHHEYYGDASGYGYFRTYLQQYKLLNPSAKQDYCIAYELEPMLDYQALAYFPAKVLEIIDVFDSLTDPNRVYRKPMESEEALDMMHAEFIEKVVKIDPVLFYIFDTFIREKQAKKK